MIAWLRDNAWTIVLGAYIVLSSIGYAFRRMSEPQQAAFAARFPRAAAFAEQCSGWGATLLTIASSFLPMFTGKPIPRLKRAIEDATPTLPSLPKSEDSKP